MNSHANADFTFYVYRPIVNQKCVPGNYFWPAKVAARKPCFVERSYVLPGFN